MMRWRKMGARWALAITLFLSSAASVAQPTPASAPGHLPDLLLDVLPARTPTPLEVASPAFAARGAIPLINTQYGANRFPGLRWSRGPAGTRSYVVIIQGRAPGEPLTSVHLTLYNIPDTVNALPAGMTAPPAGAAYGPNIHGQAAPYAGPHAHDTRPHDYYLQVFALDILLPEATELTLESLPGWMTGHVLASGDLVGTAAAPANE